MPPSTQAHRHIYLYKKESDQLGKTTNAELRAKELAKASAALLVYGRWQMPHNFATARAMEVLVYPHCRTRTCHASTAKVVKS